MDYSVFQPTPKNTNTIHHNLNPFKFFFFFFLRKKNEIREKISHISGGIKMRFAEHRILLSSIRDDGACGAWAYFPPSPVDAGGWVRLIEGRRTFCRWRWAKVKHRCWWSIGGIHGCPKHLCQIHRRCVHRFPASADLVEPGLGSREDGEAVSDDGEPCGLS